MGRLCYDFPMFLKTKKYRIISLAILVVGLVLFAYSFANVLQADTDQRITLGVLTASMCILFVFSWRTYFSNRLIRDIYAGIELYEQECNSQGFVEHSRDLADEFFAKGAPYKVQEVWFLAYYTRALADAGYADEAAQHFNELRDDALATSSKTQRAQKIINIEPLIRKLLGGQFALSALEEVREIYKEVGAAMTPREAFYVWEIDCLEKQRDGNLVGLGQEMRKATDNERNSWYVRVDCAEREAWVHRSLNHADEERDRLLFVVEHGNLLPHVYRAQQRLAELAAMEASAGTLPEAVPMEAGTPLGAAE